VQELVDVYEKEREDDDDVLFVLPPFADVC
jgi:hypothetical protein